MTYPRQRQADQSPRGGFAGYVEAPQSGYPYAGGRPYVPPPARPASAPPQSRPASASPQMWYASGPRPYIGAAAEESYGRHARPTAASAAEHTYPGQYGFRRRATYSSAPPRVSTPPAYSVPPRVSTPPAYSVPPRVSTPPAYSTPMRVSTPPAYSAPPRVSTPPAYSAPPRVSTPPAYSTPPRVSTPPAYSAPPHHTGSLTDSGFQRRQTGYTGEISSSGFPRRYASTVSDSGFQRRQTDYTGSVTDSGFQRGHSGYQDSLTDSGLQERVGWAQNAHTSGNLRRYIGEDDFPAVAPKVERGSNGFAVVAFLFGLFGGWFALVFGPLGIRRANETGRGKGLAVVGLVLGLLWLPVQGVFAYQKFVAPHAKHTTVTSAPAGPTAAADPGCVAASAAATKWSGKTNKAIATNNTKAVVADFRGYAADLTAAQKQSKNATAIAAMKAYAADMTSLANSFAKGTAPDPGAMSRLGSDGAAVAKACTG